MKRISILFLLCSILAFVLLPMVNFVFAEDSLCEEYCKDTSLGEPAGTSCICNPLGSQDIQGLLNAITNFIFWVGMALAPIILIIAGFMYVTSAGDPKRVESAKKMMLYAAIGIAVLLLARGLVVVLESILGVQGEPVSPVGPG